MAELIRRFSLCLCTWVVAAGSPGGARQGRNASFGKLALILRFVWQPHQNSRTSVDCNPYQVVIGKITLFAIESVNREWIAAKQLVESNYELYIGPGNCEILVRYLPPFRYLLFRVYNEGFPIPLLSDETLDPHDQDLLTFRDKV